MTPTFPHISGRFILPTLAAVVLVAGCFGAATVNHTPGTIMRAVMADGLEGNPDNCTKCHYAWARRFEYYHGWDRYGYVFTDRATWSSFKNRGDYKVAVEGDNKLFNQYGIILVNPAKHPKVKQAEGQAFIDWVLSAEGQTAIKAFQIGGEQQFFPNAER